VRLRARLHAKQVLLLLWVPHAQLGLHVVLLLLLWVLHAAVQQSRAQMGLHVRLPVRRIPVRRRCPHLCQQRFRRHSQHLLRRLSRRLSRRLLRRLHQRLSRRLRLRMRQRRPVRKTAVRRLALQKPIGSSVPAGRRALGLVLGQAVPVRSGVCRSSGAMWRKATLAMAKPLFCRR
jgi:hypothetical protein